MTESTHQPAREKGRRRVALAVVLALGALLLPAASAAAAPSLLTGTADSIYTSPDASLRDYWFGQTVAAGASIIRINVPWREIATGANPPANPSNPADPAYDFSAVDRAVTGAAARGLRVLITVFDAPQWAEGANEPPPAAHAPEGTWKPSPAKLGQFAEALSRRYSGTFAGPSGVLPRVQYYEAWNEPNISIYLNPQWKGNTRVSPDHYRLMLNAFYEGVHRGSNHAQVVAGSTAPFGDDGPDALRTRPLDFMRDLLCLKGKRHFERLSCAHPAKFDIYSHHPINLNGGPRKSSRDFDDVSAAADMGRLTAILRAAERLGTLGTRGRHPLWATEFFWESDPPDSRDGFPAQAQARYIEESLYFFWKLGVSAAINLQLVDSPFVPGPSSGLQSGLFFVNGQPKPAFTAFSFPFVVERQGDSAQVVAWTIPPTSAALEIQRKSGGSWHTVARGAGRDGKVLQRRLTIPGSATLRAVIGGATSLSWNLSAPGSSGGGGRHRTRRFAPGSYAPRSLTPYVEASGR
jgi:hypothetical protein